jgi:hypothetical protein
MRLLPPAKLAAMPEAQIVVAPVQGVRIRHNDGESAVNHTVRGADMCSED